MSNVQEIEDAIRQLTPSELAQLRDLVLELEREQTRAESSNLGNRKAENEIQKLINRSLEQAKLLQETLIERDAAISSSAIQTSSPAHSHSIVQPAKYSALADWVAAFRRWDETHQDVVAIADDSRDSIY
jgi:hypothetical protein